MKNTFLLLPLLFASSISMATTLDQYANSLIGFSSQWDEIDWSAKQSLGAPDTFDYGDIETAWAPKQQNGTLETLTLGFSTAVNAHGVTVRETYGNGFVYQVDATDTDGVSHTVWSGFDSSLPGTPVDFLISWAETAYLVDEITLYIDTDHNLETWEEIDSVQLHGSTVPVPAAAWLFGSGLIALLGMRRRR